MYNQVSQSLSPTYSKFHHYFIADPCIFFSREVSKTSEFIGGRGGAAYKGNDQQRYLQGRRRRLGAIFHFRTGGGGQRLAEETGLVESR